MIFTANHEVTTDAATVVDWSKPVGYTEAVMVDVVTGSRPRRRDLFRPGQLPLAAAFGGIRIKVDVYSSEVVGGVLDIDLDALALGAGAGEELAAWMSRCRFGRELTAEYARITRTADGLRLELMLGGSTLSVSLDRANRETHGAAAVFAPTVRMVSRYNQNLETTTQIAPGRAVEGAEFLALAEAAGASAMARGAAARV